MQTKGCFPEHSALDHTEKSAGETGRGLARTGTGCAHRSPPRGWDPERECRASPGAGAGRRERALTAVVGQRGAVPPSGTVPWHLIVPAVFLPGRPLPGLGLCGDRGFRARPCCPPSLLPPAPHLLIFLESDPDGLHVLVVGDDFPQGDCLVDILHPGQVRSFLEALAPTLRGQLSVPGLLRETRGPRSPVPLRWAYLSLVPAQGLGKVLEAAEIVVGPAGGAVAYVPAICSGRAAGRDEPQAEERGSLLAQLQEQLPPSLALTHRPQEPHAAQ